MVVSIALILLFISYYPMGERSLRFLWHVLHDCPIGFVNFAIPEHIVQTAQCLRSLGKYNQTRNRTVKAMHHTEKYISRLVILLLDVLFHSLRERFVAGLVALHDFATSLRDYDYMVVFVNYLHVLSIKRLPRDYMFIPPSI